MKKISWRKISKWNYKGLVNSFDYYILYTVDYIHMDPVAAMADFKERIKNYEKVYQTISEEEEEQNMSFIKIMYTYLYERP